MTLQERLEQESKETSVIQVPLGNVNDSSILEQYPGERVALAELNTPGNCSAKPSLLPCEDPDQKCPD